MKSVGEGNATGGTGYVMESQQLAGRNPDMSLREQKLGGSGARPGPPSRSRLEEPGRAYVREPTGDREIW